jgi:hypothetical protein
MLQTGRLSVRVPDEVNFFNLLSPTSLSMPLRSIQPLRDMSTRNVPGDKGRPAHKTDNFTGICEPTVGASTSRNPKGLDGLYRDNFLPFTAPYSQLLVQQKTFSKIYKLVLCVFSN